MLVRVLAETGVKNLMRKVHQLTRSYPDIAKTVKLRGQWIPVDPAGWRERTSMSVNVGLGFNDKSKEVGMAVQLLTLQKEGLALGMVGREEIYATLEKLIQASAFGETSQYFVKPGSQRDQMLKQQMEQQQQSKPKDPALVIAEAQVQSFAQDSQTKAMKAQADAQNAQTKAQMAGMEAQHKAQIAQHQSLMDERELALKEQQEQFKAAQAEFEREKWRAEHQLKRELALSQKRKDIAAALKLLEEAEAANPGENLNDRTAFVFDALEGRMKMAEGAEDGPADMSFDDELDDLVEGDLANADR